MMKNIYLILAAGLLIFSSCQCQNGKNASQEENALQETSAEQVMTQSSMPKQYAIVAGAYRELNLATRKKEQLDGKGYPASIVSYEGGLYAVVISPSDDLDDVKQQLETFVELGVCPKDSWILTRE